MFIKLTKLDSLLEGAHPNGIEQGYVAKGFMEKEPTVGESFEITNSGYWFTTSTVQEIIDENTFKTLNSIYKIERQPENNK
jgi:hypothetical protein